jgi:hypothetical protein
LAIIQRKQAHKLQHISAKALLCEEQLGMINFIPSKLTLNAALLHEYSMKTGKI